MYKENQHWTRVDVKKYLDREKEIGFDTVASIDLLNQVYTKYTLKDYLDDNWMDLDLQDRDIAMNDLKDQINDALDDFDAMLASDLVSFADAVCDCDMTGYVHDSDCGAYEPININDLTRALPHLE